MPPHVHHPEPPISAITGLAVPPFLLGDTLPRFSITCTSVRRCCRCRPHGNKIPDTPQQRHHVSIKYDVRVVDFRYEYWTWDDLQIAVRHIMAWYHLPGFQLRYEGSQNGYFQVKMYRPSGLRKVTFPDDEDTDTVEEAVEDASKDEAAPKNTAVEDEARILKKAISAGVPIWMSKIDPDLQSEDKAAVNKRVREARMKKIVVDDPTNKTVAEATANNPGDIPMPLSNIDPRLQGGDVAVVQNHVDEAAVEEIGKFTRLMADIGPSEWDMAPMDYNGDYPMSPPDAPSNGDNGAAGADTEIEAVVAHIEAGVAAVRNAGDDTAMDDVQHHVTRSNHSDDQAVVDHREDHTTRDNTEGENVVRNADQDATMRGIQHETNAYASDDKAAVGGKEDTPMGEDTREKAVLRNADDDTVMDGAQGVTGAGDTEDRAPAGNTAGRRIVHKRKAEDDLDDVSRRRPTM